MFQGIVVFKTAILDTHWKWAEPYMYLGRANPGVSQTESRPSVTYM